MALKTATREQKIDFINKNIRLDNKTIPKKLLKTWPDKKIDSICAQFEDLFNDFIDNPPKKMTKFFIEATKDGESFSMGDYGEDVDACKKAREDEGYVVTKIVPAKGHHLCKYCYGIAEGSQEDILCENCRNTFGHYSYHEL